MPPYSTLNPVVRRPPPFSAPLKSLYLTATYESHQSEYCVHRGFEGGDG